MSMEVISARSALLSNFEVLTLLRELESDQLARQKTAIRVKKEEEERIHSLAASKEQNASSVPTQSQLQVLQEDVCENLRTVEFEAIKYLTAEYQPLHRQTDERIQRLVKGLAPYDFTKAEKLQIVNLAPTEPVELYVIVEEIEDRLGDRMEEVLEITRDSLGGTPAAPSAQVASSTFNISVYDVEYDDRPGWDDGGEGEEQEYDDIGEGAGVEGDLEMDED